MLQSNSFKNFVRVLCATAAIAAIVVAGAQSAAVAQSAAPSPVSDIPAFDQSGAIPLRPAPNGAQTEQWDSFVGDPVVRNVTAPTLTPVLPDPAKATGAAVIVAPGGGFIMLSIQNEGFAVAHWLADHGIAAFVLKYRTRETPRDNAAFFNSFMALLSHGPNRGDHADANAAGKPPLEPAEATADVQAALRLVRSHAQQWHIDPARVGTVGFSAGAMLSLSAGIAPDAATRPNFIGVIYGPMDTMAVPPDAPPAFFAAALDDPLVAMHSDMGVINSWRHAGRPIEVHLYRTGSHGFGMNSRFAAPAAWIDEFYDWMKDLGVLKGGPTP